MSGLWKKIVWSWEDFKAWRRGEKRVAPHGVTGRIYERVSGEHSSMGKVEARTQGIVSISARKYNSQTGQWEDLGEIAKGTITEQR